MQLRTTEKKVNAALCRLHTDEDTLMTVQKRNVVQFAHIMEEIDWAPYFVSIRNLGERSCGRRDLDGPVARVVFGQNYSCQTVVLHRGRRLAAGRLCSV